MTLNGVLVAPDLAPVKKIPGDKRVQSIDLLRGIVMIVMAIDHVRDYFNKDAFLYSPTDLEHTDLSLFLTRWITHYCAPIFVMLAGISASLYGAKKTTRQLARFLFKRGLWLVFAELFIVTLGWTFNPGYPVFNLQVIWAIGICMIVLSAMVFMDLRLILLTGLLLICCHNLLDGVHVTGSGPLAFLWAVLHDPADITIGTRSFFIHYPVLPWIGIMATGYFLGQFYQPQYNPQVRKKLLFLLGTGSLLLFFFFRSVNSYGDPAHWSGQKTLIFSALSFMNVTKYPPSFLYTLVTIGPALLFLAFAERPLNRITAKIAVLGRVPMFYYVIHLFLIHALAIVGVMIAGYPAAVMILSDRVNRVAALRGYGFGLPVVYLVWLTVILLLYPLCKRFDRYKRANIRRRWWLSYW
jgi:uncharacterized membrane protein